MRRLTLAFAFGTAFGLAPTAQVANGLPMDATASHKTALEAYGKLPLAFVPNAGQTHSRVRLYAHASGASFFFAEQEAVFTFRRENAGAALALRFVGARPQTRPEGRGQLPGRVNYLIGSDPARWKTDLRTYGEVVYRELWPGIDLAFRGADGQLKYEFILRPGAEVSDIRLDYRGAESLSLDPEGNLLVKTSLGTLTDARPVTYQEIRGERVPVASRYRLGQGERYGFAVGAYDRQRPLVIDPGLLYSTYLGGTSIDRGFGIAVDATGHAYVTGFASTDFPTSTGAFDTSGPAVAFHVDAFVTKLDASGSALVYSTYLGGSREDEGHGIVVDANGNAHVTGLTGSVDFPTTPAAFDTTNNGGADAFVAKLDPSGSTLLYSTYLGGSSNRDAGQEIALHAGDAYVTGYTASADFPTTPGAFDTTHSGDDDAFVAKLDASGSTLLYSTYLGGGGVDEGFGITVDVVGAAYVTGMTTSSNFPTTPFAFDTTFNRVSEAFVTKLNALGSAPLVYSTYLGGNGNEVGRGIAIDAAGNAYVTGHTDSADFPTTPAAYDTTLNGSNADAFVTKLNVAGSAPLLYSTYLGGSMVDEGFQVAIDAAGDAYVTGYTSSADFPTTPGAHDTTYNCCTDVFVTKLNAAGSAPLLYSTYLGGAGVDVGHGIALDAVGNAYVTGETSSANFPTTPAAFDTTYNGSGDAFVAKIGEPIGPPATLRLDPPAGTNSVETQHCVTATVEDASGTPVPGVTVRFTVTGSVNASGSDTTDDNGEARFCYQGPSLPGTDVITAYADSDDDNTRDVGEPTGTAAKIWLLPETTPLCEIAVTNGGRITAANGDRATFGGNARADAEGNTQGQEQYQDHGPAQPLNVHSINVLAIVCDGVGEEATIYGQATVNGTGSYFYRIKVRDLGEPGVGQDTYWILLQSGYTSGDQVLEGGNVQIRRE